jgi:hypothetical protein
VALQYWLRQPADTLTIEILDGAGKVIRTYTAEPRDTTRRDSTAAAGDDDDDDGPRRRGPRGPSMEAGLHMQEWDMHYASATTFPGMILWGATTSGPMALPGNYTARLTVDGKTLTQPVVLKLNPLEENVTLAGLREQFELGMRIRDKVSEANEAVIRIRDMKKLTAVRLTKSSDPALTALADTFTRHLSDVEEAIYQVRNRSGQDPLNFPIKINNRLATLLRTVTRGDGEPIGAAEPIFNDLSAELEVETNRLAKVIAQELVRLNAMLEKLGVEKVGEGEKIS